MPLLSKKCHLKISNQRSQMRTLHYKKHLCPTLLTLSASFPERHIKGYVHSEALCSLKCSRAATDPQILTFKPSGGKSEQQQQEGGREGETEMERWEEKGKHMDRGTEGNVLWWVLSDLWQGLNLLWLNMCLPAVNVSREERVYWCGGGSTQR